MEEGNITQPIEDFFSRIFGWKTEPEEVKEI